MPAFTPVAPQSLPTVADATGAVRPVKQVATAVSSFAGAGFPVRRPFPGALDLEHTDPFLMLDQMGPIVYAPGEAVGAPDHPHRGSRPSRISSTARWSTAIPTVAAV